MHTSHTCVKCNLEFDLKSKYENHVRLCGKIIREIECGACFQKYPEGSDHLPQCLSNILVKSTAVNIIPKPAKAAKKASDGEVVEITLDEDGEEDVDKEDDLEIIEIF